MATNHTNPSAPEAPMQRTAEQDCRDFAAQFGHLPNVKAAMAYAEAGTLRWSDVAEVFRASLAQGLAAV